MAMDQESVTVRILHTGDGKGPVCYASLPCGSHAAVSSTGYEANSEEIKHRLVSTLCDHPAIRESPLWQRRQSCKRSAFPIQVRRGLLGRPHLLLGKYPGPAVSFSTGGGKVWAALCGDESDIGIDVAGSDEFQREYPFHRVFQPQELLHTLRLTGGDPAEASALLWSVKEAVVKALGCAFHLVEPRHINVYPSVEDTAVDVDGYTFPVRLTGKALVRFPLAAAGRPLWVHSLPQGKRWLSIAILDRSATGHE